MCSVCKSLLTDVRSTCRSRESTDADEVSSRYRKRKATEVENMQNDLDKARMQVQLLEDDRECLVFENSKVERCVETTMHTHELLKSSVGCNTALGHVLSILSVFAAQKVASLQRAVTKKQAYSPSSYHLFLPLPPLLLLLA